MIKNVAKRLFRLRTLPNTKRLRKFLGPEDLVVVDVGATGGPAGIWEEVSSLTHFVFFDPDPRAAIKADRHSATVYPVGLWSGKAEKVLHLTANPEASSVFELNTQVLDDFLNSSMHEVLRKEPILLDTMSDVVKGKKPDFIKVDAEGADLEILRGAERFLKESCLGVFVEVSFAGRHKEAPFFGDTDAYMRSLDFMLMDLYLSHWLRSSDVFGLFSRPQVIWANALYILRREAFLTRLESLEDAKRKPLFAKFLTILLLHQAHDYASEIVAHASHRKLVSKSEANEAQGIIAAAMSNAMPNMIKLLAATLLSCIGLVLFLPVRTLRSDNVLFLKMQLSALCGVVLQFARYRLRGSLVDPADPTSRL